MKPGWLYEPDWSRHPSRPYEPGEKEGDIQRQKEIDEGLAIGLVEEVTVFRFVPRKNQDTRIFIPPASDE